MDKKIFKPEELPLDEKIYLRKSFDGWRVVHPTKNEDGTTNYPNLLFGGWWNLVKMIFLIILLALVVFGINELISNYREVANHPCNYCSLCSGKIIPSDLTGSKIKVINGEETKSTNPV